MRPARDAGWLRLPMSRHAGRISFRHLTVCIVVLATGLWSSTIRAADPTPAVASKAFTESLVLAEVLRAEAAEHGIELEHRAQLGGSRICFEALQRGEIIAYPEYTGTLIHELLGHTGAPPTAQELDAELSALGLAMGPPLGFNNTYAVGVRRELAEALGLRTISDLARHPELAWGVSSEFLEREDGFPGLSARYGLEPEWVRGMDHQLAYRALTEDSIQVIDLYSTDADIEYYDLVVLEDDLGYFPRYDAFWLFRRDIDERAPGLRDLIEGLGGRIDEARMTRMNARVKIEGLSEAAAAAEFLGLDAPESERGRAGRILERSFEHLALVSVSLGAAILIAIPLGIMAARSARLGQLVLAATGVLQTLPSLALFVLLIPIFGIGAKPAVAALFLYSLLPIVRNTHAGLVGIARPLRESALALGLSSTARLRLVELPLAARSILAGIKTAAVINVGTATLGALIGAGGYGQPILTGIRRDDFGLILEGAVPAAVLALAVQGLFDLVERGFTPRGLR